MQFEENKIYHVFNRGNQQQKIFFKRENYLFFLQKIRKDLLPLCDLLAYCLMPNHYHLMLEVQGLTTPSGLTNSSSGQTTESRQTTMHPLSRKIGTLQSSYARAIQNQENFTGSLFQQKTKAVELKTELQ